MTNTTTEPGKPPALTKQPSGVVGAIVPQTITEVVQLSGMVAKAGWAPESYRRDVPKNEAGGRVGNRGDQPFDEDKIAIGIMQGLEVGLKPIQALQSIAVINGIPALYGDSMLAVINATGAVEDFAEEPIMSGNDIIGWTATMKRKGRPTPTVRSFTIEQAKAANLLDKAGPWKQYRSRMLQMRARALCLRDSFPDALKGLQMVEEAIDVQVVANNPVPTTPALAAPKSAVGKLDAFAGGATPAEEQKAGAVQDAAFEEVKHDPVTGEVQEEQTSAFDTGGLPASVLVAFEAATYRPYLEWCDVELQKLEGAAKQAFVDDQADRLNTVRASGSGAANGVKRLLEGPGGGATLLEPTAAD